LPAEPRWLSVEAIAAINGDIAEKTGEPHVVLDPAALKSAVAHPWNVWVYFMDQDIAVLAARLYTSLCAARAFAAGNKRTALAAATAFVEANGYELDLGDNRLNAIARLAEFSEGRLSQAGVVEWFRLWMAPPR
jgi:death-on-curing protein